MGALNHWSDAVSQAPVRHCPRHFFIDMVRRVDTVIALCNGCHERIEVPTAEFAQMCVRGEAAGKPGRL